MTPADLKEARRKLGFSSQGALAEMLDVRPQTAGDWERGKARIPRAVELLLAAMIETGWRPAVADPAAGE